MSCVTSSWNSVSRSLNLFSYNTVGVCTQFTTVAIKMVVISKAMVTFGDTNDKYIEVIFLQIETITIHWLQ